VDYQHISCYGDRNGELRLTGSGGGGGYFYSLDGIGYQRSGFYGGLQDGSYTTYVQDANGCVSAGEIVEILEPEELEVKIQSDTIIESGSDLQITTSVWNNQGEVFFDWEADPEQDLSCIDCLDLYINDIKNGKEHVLAEVGKNYADNREYALFDSEREMVALVKKNHGKISYRFVC